MTQDAISIYEQEAITAFLKRIGEFGMTKLDSRVEDHLKQAYRLCYHCLLTVNYGSPVTFLDDEGYKTNSLWASFSNEGFDRITASDTQRELQSLQNAMSGFIENNSLHPTIKHSLQLSCDQVLLAFLILRVKL